MNKFVQFWQKNNTDQGYFSLRFLIAGIILSAAFLLLFASFNKTYTSSMVVFANAKSEAAAQQKDQIIKNDEMYIVEEIQEYQVNQEIENNKKQCDLLTTVYEG